MGPPGGVSPQFLTAWVSCEPSSVVPARAGGRESRRTGESPTMGSPRARRTHVVPDALTADSTIATIDSDLAPSHLRPTRSEQACGGHASAKDPTTTSLAAQIPPRDNVTPNCPVTHPLAGRQMRRPQFLRFSRTCPTYRRKPGMSIGISASARRILTIAGFTVTHPAGPSARGLVTPATGQGHGPPRRCKSLCRKEYENFKRIHAGEPPRFT